MCNVTYLYFPVDKSKKMVIILLCSIEDLCNGSTPDSDSVCGGSNPSSSAKREPSEHGSSDCHYCNRVRFALSFD